MGLLIVCLRLTLSFVKHGFFAEIAFLLAQYSFYRLKSYGFRKKYL